MELKSLQNFIEIAKTKKKKKLVIAAAADEPVLIAVKHATEEGITEPVLVGDKSQIESISKTIGFNLNNIEIFDVVNDVQASVEAVSFIREGKADFLMKGMVQTGTLLKAVLDKENGLRKGTVLSHIALFESPYYHKLLCVTDVAMNIVPDIDQKVEIINNAVELYHKLGIICPKVAVVCAVETVNPKMEATVHAAILTQMNKNLQIKGCIIYGPLALDNAVSKEAAVHKGIVNEVTGDCDIILVPDINSGNIFYKSLNFLGGAFSAAVIMGATVPIVLTSRSDSDKSKMFSIALAAAIA